MRVRTFPVWPQRTSLDCGIEAAPPRRRPRSASALADALMLALTDHLLRERLVIAGERRARAFSMERLAEVYVDTYERAIAMARG